MAKKFTIMTIINTVWLRKSVIWALIFSIVASLILPTVAYAQEAAAKDAGKDEKFDTLVTDVSTVDSLPYIGEGRGIKSLIPQMTLDANSLASATVVEAARVRKLAKADFRPNEEIKVTIENGADKEFKTELIDAVGNKIAVDTEEVETGAAKVITLEQPTSFRPGKYTLKITDGRGGVSEQDFSWGVLAINPDKSIYTPGETANLAIGVLDEAGNMVCDAQVELGIKNEKLGIKETLSTDNKKIFVNPECISHDFTLRPDYETQYKVGAPGKYEMTLKAQTKNGTFTINDSFEVRASVAFDIKRVTATRIYPPNTYPVTMEITANQDFEGTIAETVPAKFKIARAGETITDVKNDFDPAAASASAEPSVVAPDNLPQGIPAASTPDIIAYNTINTIKESVGGPAVLGAAVPGLLMPFSGPYPISQEFGQSLVTDIHDHDLYESFGMHGHDGIDFAMPEGTPLIAVDSGKILVAGDGDYGTTIIIEHAWGRSYYGHLSAVDVQVGQEVQAGAVIGKSGNTGISTGPHLHFGLKPKVNDVQNGFYGKVDPAYYLGMKQSAGAVLGVATKIEPDAPVTSDIKVLTWKVNLKKGDKIKIGYSYLAPRISPQFYTLGPATFTDKNGEEVFHEIRKWQIASDALEYKFKRGTFSKSTCTAVCTQSVAGIGFKPKAVIFEWSNATNEGFATSNNLVAGMGFATSPTEERTISYRMEDASATIDTSTIHSDTRSIIIHLNTTGTTVAEADFLSFDPDGFTLSWAVNDSNANMIHYTAIGGADVSNTKVGSFTLSSTGSTQSFTNVGFQPDFMMFMSNGGGASGGDWKNASMSAGFAASPSKEGAISWMSIDDGASTDSCRTQRTDASIVLFVASAGCGTPAIDTVADVASFDATGFTLNVPDTPAQSLPVYFLAIKGGQYDVGAFTQPTTRGEQSVYTGFRPTGLMTLAASTSATTAIQTTGASMSIGGASRDGGTGWCNDTTGTQCTASWSARKKITINNTASTEDLMNFPLLVRLNSNTIDYTKTQNSGQDLRFVDPSDPNVVLSHEVEEWNESGTSYVWVKVPKLDRLSRTDHIWMYYGNANTTDGQDSTGVWDSSFKGVWHMDETSGEGQHGDSTANANNATTTSVSTQGTATGQIDGASDFNNIANTVNVPDANSLDATTAFTVSAWARTDVIDGGYDCIMNKNNYYICLANTGEVEGGFVAADGTFYGAVSSGAGLVTGTFYHFQVTFSGTTVTVYRNGTQIAQRTDAVQAPDTDGGAYASASLAFGNNPDGDEEFDGIVDEVRVSNIARSTEWMEAEYRTSTNAMNTFGVEETQASAGHAYSQGSLWTDDVDAIPDANNSASSRTDTVIQFGTSPRGTGASRTLARANLQSFDSTGFTVNWSEVDSNARQVLYWAVGSVTASQEDYRWYKNANSITPSTAMEAENKSTILAKNNPYTRLRTSLSVGGNGLNASTQGFKLQYTTDNRESGVQAATNDWCNDTTGVTCTAPGQGEIQATTTTDWCNDTTGVTCTADWSSRRKITFKNASSSAALTDFPVLVKLDSTRVNYNKTQSDGDDIRFVDPSDPTVALNHEIEGTWSNSGTNYVWVKVPQIDARSNNDYIWMYYGNSLVSSPATQLGSTAHETGVWNSGYEFVHHFEETASCGAASNEATDSTTNANNADCIASGPTSNVSSKIGNGRTFDGTDDYFQIPYVTDFDAAAGQTIDLWINTTNISEYQEFVAHWDDEGWGFYGFATTFPPSCNAAGRICYFDSGTGDVGVDSGISASSWAHVTWVANGTNGTFYVNGVRVGSVTGVAPPQENDVGVRIGRALGGGGPFGGSMDEVRYSTTPRSADWVLATYLTENDQFNTYGSEFSYAETQQQSSGWQYRKKITFNNASASAALTDFPVMVKLNAANIDYTKTQDDGGDIRFVDPADNTTVLSHEIESWNENGNSVLWVKVPSLAAGTGDYIYMYYGNPGASDGQNATGVWDSNYVGVWHMDESSGTNISDSTNVNNGTKSSAGSPSGFTGKVDGAQDFDGTDDYITVSDHNSLDVTTLTVSTWVFLDNSNSGEAQIVDKRSGGTGGFNLRTGGDGSSPADIAFIAEGSTGTESYNASDDRLAHNRWHYITVSYNAATNAIMYYLNGIYLETDTASQTVATNTWNLRFGDVRTGAPTAFNLDGKMDETRLSNTVRSTDWIEAEYLSQTDQMNVFGEEQPYATGGTAVSGWQDVADVWCNDTSGVTCNTSWSHRKRITINNQSSSTNLSSFPILVKLDSSRIDYTKTQDDGDDIRFVDPADPTTVLDHEIETWNESGASYVWVEVPQLDANSTSDSIWMYYGNASVSNGENITGTWNSGYVAVYHFNETSGQHQDSTGNANNATTTTVSQQGANIGKIDGASEFDGTDDYVRAPDHSSLGGMSSLTVETWFRPDNTPATNKILSYKNHAAGGTYAWQMLYLTSGRAYLEVNTSGTDGNTQSEPVNVGDWNHYAGVYDSGQALKSYLNGSNSTNYADTPSGAVIDADSHFNMGGGFGASGSYDGALDEQRISNVARSEDWLEATYLTTIDQMNTYGAEETQTSAAWRFKENSSVTNGTTITSAVLGTSSSGNQQTYQEANPTALLPTAIAVGEKREFDFALDGTNASSERTYYFRIVNADGTPLTSYTRYPTITFGVPKQKVMRGGKFVNYGSRQPFTF